jgi:hypothetical protein
MTTMLHAVSWFGTIRPRHMRIFAASLIMSGMIVAPARAQDAGSAEKASATIGHRCSSCHASSVVYGARHSETEWRQVLNRMVARGVQLGPEERVDLLKFLASRSAASGKGGASSR